MLVVSTLFGMLGGLFGALMFRKNPPPVAAAADSADSGAAAPDFRSRDLALREPLHI